MVGSDGREVSEGLPRMSATSVAYSLAFDNCPVAPRLASEAGESPKAVSSLERWLSL